MCLKMTKELAFLLGCALINHTIPAAAGVPDSADKQYYTLYSGTAMDIAAGVADGKNSWRNKNWLGSAVGAAVHDDKLRVYFHARIDSVDDNLYYIETENSDLELGWCAPVECDTSLMSVFYHHGWKGTKNVGGHLVKYESEDGINWSHVGTAFTQGKIDGKGNTFYDANLHRYVHYGRVRGNTSEAGGGWRGSGDETTRRRGISLHRSAEGQAWNDNALWGVSETIADPKDFFDYTAESPLDAPGTFVDADDRTRVLGQDYQNLVRYDFYSPNAFWDADAGLYRAFVIVFQRSSARIVDRARRMGYDYPHPDNTWENRDLDSSGAANQARFRYIGPWYPVEMTSDNGKDFTMVAPMNEGLVNDRFLKPMHDIWDDILANVYPQPPYAYTGEASRYPLSAVPEPLLVDAYPSIINWRGGRYILYNKTGRGYFAIPENVEYDYSIRAKKIGSVGH